MLYGIWRYGDNEGWCRDNQYGAILAFESERQAEHVAADEFGYVTYEEAKADDWVEVRRLDTAASPAVAGT